MLRTKKWALILAAALWLLPAGGRTELPGGLMVIEEEAFMNNASLQSVRLPQSTVEIGARAFFGCTSLSRIVIPSNVETMGEDCLSGCAGDLLIVTEKNSAAMAWAQTYNMDFQAGTRYCALLIGQTYGNHALFPTLYGPPNDLEAMARCLSRLEGTAYETVIEMDLTASGILSAIQQHFAGAEEQDVSLVYYSGHGNYSNDAAMRGALVGVDGKFVTAAQLRAALDAVPGRKIVIIDSCFSGGLIAGGEYGQTARGAKETPENGAEAFLDSFMEAFSRQTRSANYSRYFLLTSAAENEEAYEDRVGGRAMGLFTAAFVTGMGWNSLTQAPGAFLADRNQNGAVTLREAYEYTWGKMVLEGQHVQVYPSSCDWLALGRQAY